MHLSFGDFAGSEYLGQVISDVVVHSWDLARAIGADDRLDPALVAFVDEFLSPQIDAWRAAGAFGPAVDVGADANDQDRLLAQTGRPSNSTAVRRSHGPPTLRWDRHRHPIAVRIMPAATVWWVASSMSTKLPVERLRR